jgi:hypothetical protein
MQVVFQGWQRYMETDPPQKTQCQSDEMVLRQSNQEQRNKWSELQDTEWEAKPSTMQYFQ